MNKRRECWYTPLIQDEEGKVTNEPAEYSAEGYFEYWGSSSEVINMETVVGVMPVALNLTIAIVSDKRTGKVFIVRPQHIRFKITDDK